MDPTAFLRRAPWWAWIVAVDLVLLAFTGLAGVQPDWPYAWRLSHLLPLTREMNLGAWWSGACLFAVALLAWERFVARSRTATGRAWLGLAFVAALLSFDEIGSIHERLRLIDSLERFSLGAIAVASVPLYVVVTLVRREETRRAGALIAAAFGLFAAVAAQERIEVTVDWTGVSQAMRVARPMLEEGTELAAMLVLLAAVVGQRRRAGHRSLASGLATAWRHPAAGALTVAGLAGHLAVCLVVTPALTDVPPRGNPAVWYPVVMNLVLAAAMLQAAGTGRRSAPAPAARLAAAAFAISSAALMADLFKLVPVGGDGGLHALWGRLWVLYAWQSLVLVALSRRRTIEPVHGIAGLCLAAAVAAAHVPLAGRPGLMLAAYGSFVCVLGLVVLAPAASRRPARDDVGRFETARRPTT